MAGKPMNEETNSNPDKVLVVVEEVSRRSQLRRTLEGFGFDLGEASPGENARTRLQMVGYDAILLDFPVEIAEGIAMCSDLRELHPRIPIFVLSDSDHLDSKVDALEAGADDYIVNPFSERELTARLRAAIRRYRASAVTTNSCVAVGDIRLDPDKLCIEKSGNEIFLTHLEFRALHILMAQAGKPVTHASLLSFLWGPECTKRRENLRVLINALRKKLEDDPAHPVHLMTHSHFGYFFRAAHAVAAR
jgi:two-component system, OmpR family, KDP operon response regulator KdpE